MLGTQFHTVGKCVRKSIWDVKSFKEWVFVMVEFYES